MNQEFWVVGGSYRDMTFATFDPGGGELHGPFKCYGEALLCWRQRASETRSSATTRFAIAATALQTLHEHRE
jgi:hypothetical protein